jgi:hypothetical protein
MKKQMNKPIKKEIIKHIKEKKQEPLYYKGDEVIYNGEKYIITSSKFFNSKDNSTRGFWYRFSKFKYTVHERL